MVSDKLLVNLTKTEYLLFYPKHFNNPNCSINIDSDIISPNDSAKNLCIIFQPDISMSKHYSEIVKSCFLQIRNFHRIRPFISKTVAIALANAFVHSHIDCYNSLFYGLPKYRLQRIQNTKCSCSYSYI